MKAPKIKPSSSAVEPSQIKTSPKIDEAYSSEPWWYDARGFLILTLAYNDTLPHQIRHFAKNMRTQHLEVAVGSGTFLEVVLKYRRWKKWPVINIIGFDYAPSMLQGATHRFRKNKNIQLQLADAANMPFKDNQFDSLSCANAIHSFPELEKSLRECFRVLKPGGIFVGNCLITPRGIWPLNWIAKKINSWGQRKGILHRAYDLTEIKDLLMKAGFKNLEEDLRGNCLSFVVTKNIKTT
ncbi:MAG: methyltransferase domain-containing protein [Bdellovibrionaceae bacterium]|nr:methyltransferase domain-containing protein [Pseudobdellovibrionaceae bacterium]